jgi:hypothetical protein
VYRTPLALEATPPTTTSAPAPALHPAPLDSPETPVSTALASPPFDTTPDADGLTWTFRHSGSRYERTAVYAALKALNVGFRRRDSFAACGSSVWLLESRTRPGVYKLTADLCHDRWCPACGRLRADLVAGNVLAALAGKPARLVSLTIRASATSLKAQLTRLYRTFRKLRSLPVWKQRVDGGLASLEITYNEQTNRYHPHLHCLTHGRFIPLEDLRREWLRLTGDSFEVDVRYVQDNERAARYVTKYLAKPVDHAIYHSPAALQEAIEAVRGVKQLITFGDWRKMHLTRSPKDDDWRSLGHWHELCVKDDHDTRIVWLAILRNPFIAAKGEFTLLDLDQPHNNTS